MECIRRPLLSGRGHRPYRVALLPLSSPPRPAAFPALFLPAPAMPPRRPPGALGARTSMGPRRHDWWPSLGSAAALAGVTPRSSSSSPRSACCSTGWSSARSCRTTRPMPLRAPAQHRQGQDPNADPRRGQGAARQYLDHQPGSLRDCALISTLLVHLRPGLRRGRAVGGGHPGWQALVAAPAREGRPAP
jgi:hypothetical protein